MGDALRALISDTKKTTRAREALQRVGRSLRAFYVGGAPPRGDSAGGRASVRTVAWQRRDERFILHAVTNGLNRRFERRATSSKSCGASMTELVPNWPQLVGTRLYLVASVTLMTGPVSTRLIVVEMGHLRSFFVSMVFMGEVVSRQRLV